MSEPATTDVAELFRRDPLTLTRADIAPMIAELRRARATFNLGAKAEPKPKAKVAKTALGQIDLSELGL